MKFLATTLDSGNATPTVEDIDYYFCKRRYKYIIYDNATSSYSGYCGLLWHVHMHRAYHL